MSWPSGIWFSNSGSIPRRFARTGGAHLLTFDCPDFQSIRLRRGFDPPDQILILLSPQVNLAPPLGECLHSPAGQRLPRLGRPVFLGKPLAFALRLDPGAVDQEMQCASAGAIRNGDVQTARTARQRAEVRPDSSRSGPLEPGQSSGKQSPGLFSDPPHIQQACHQPSSPWSLGPVAFPWLDLPHWQPEPSPGAARSGLKRSTGSFPGRPSPFNVRHA